MLTGVRTRLVMMWMGMQMRRKQHRKPMRNQCRIWRTDPGKSGVEGCECEDGDNMDTDEEKATSQADD